MKLLKAQSSPESLGRDAESGMSSRHTKPRDISEFHPASAYSTSGK